MRRQRQWSETAIRRTTPVLLGLFSLVTLLAHRQIRGREPSGVAMGMGREQKISSSWPAGWARSGLQPGRDSVKLVATRSSEGVSVALPSFHFAGQTWPGFFATSLILERARSAPVR